MPLNKAAIAAVTDAARQNLRWFNSRDCTLCKVDGWNPCLWGGRHRLEFQPRQALQRGFARIAAHVFTRPQRCADSGSLWQAKQPAAFVIVKLDTANAGRLAVRHAGNRSGDRRSDAAGTAQQTAFHV